MALARRLGLVAALPPAGADAVAVTWPIHRAPDRAELAMWRRVVAKDAAGEVLDPEERAWLDARSARDLADLFESQLQSIARAWRVGRLHTFDSDAAEALEMLAESFEA